MGIAALPPRRLQAPRSVLPSTAIRRFAVSSCTAGIKDLLDQPDFPANALVILTRPDSPGADADASDPAMRNLHEEIALAVG